MRVYKNATFTISSTTKDIAKIVVTAIINNTIGANGFVADGYAAATDKSTGTWTGNSKSITLTASGGQVRLTKVDVYFADASDTRTATEITFADGYATKILKDSPFDVLLPTATVTAGGTAVAGATVTWESSDENIVAIAGNKLNAKEQGKVTITATYAGNTTYKSSTKSYELKSYKGYFTLAEMVGDVTNGNSKWTTGELVVYLMADEDGGNITPREELVTYANGKYTYITNGTQNMLLYGSGLDLAQGDKIKPAELNVATGTVKAIYGTLKIFNGLPELEVEEADVTKTSTGNSVTPTTITIAQLANNINNYVKIENAEYVSADGKTLTFKVGDESFTVYNQWGIDITSLAVGSKYTLTGMGAVYKKNDTTTYQLYPIDFTLATAIDGITTIDDADAPVYNLQGQRVGAEYRGVVIKNGKKLIQK